MRKLLAILALAFPALASGQYVAVSAQLKDVNGSVYQNCSYNAVFVGQSSLPGPYLASGSVFQQSFAGARCDSSGNLSIRLLQNSAISPTPSQWQFNFCDQTGKYCGQTLITISGTTQDISADLTAVAPILPTSGGGGTITGSGTTNNVAKWTTSSSIGNSLLSDNGTLLSYGAMKTLSLSSGTSNLYTSSPTVPGSEPCSNLNALTYIQDASASNHTQTAIDAGLTVNGFTNNGFLNFCRPPIFNSSGQTPGFAMNGVSFNVYGQFSPTHEMSAQWRFENPANDSSTYNIQNINQVYSEFVIHGTPTINSTFVSNMRLRSDDRKTGGSKPRVWSVYQGETSKIGAYDITNCTGGIDGFSNGPCYAIFYGETGTLLGGSESQTGVSYDVFAGGTKDLGHLAPGGTGNVFHALVQSSTTNRFDNTRGFVSEDFGTAAAYYNFLSNGVNAAGTPSGYNAFVGPISLGSVTHAGAGIQVAVAGGNLQLQNSAGVGSRCLHVDANGTVTALSGDCTTAIGPRPSLGNWSHVTAKQVGLPGLTLACGNALSGDGFVLKPMTGTGLCGGGVSQTSNGTDPARLDASGTTSHAAVWLDQPGDIHLAKTTGRRLSDWQVSHFAIDSTAVRYWVGLWVSSSISEGDLETDTPSSFIGFRFSTEASDTTWKCVMQTTVADSGVAIDTTANHIFELQNVSANMLYLIDGVQVCSIDMTSATLATNYFSTIWADSAVTGAAAGRSASFSWLYSETLP